jgi:murein DD-endopeptidase MepM/ murein hydrolase activator NlpD
MKVGGYANGRGRGVSLGDEPPLLVDGAKPRPDRRAVSVRWLMGTVLTGVTSVVLMGGALVVALEDHISIAAPARQLGAELRPLLEEDAGPARKSDKVQPIVEAVTNRQVIQVSTVTRQGDRDLIRVRPFVKVTASLATRVGDQVANIPPFNPLAIFSDSEIFPDRSPTDSIYGAEVEGEVTVATRDFPLGSPLVDPGLSLTAEEVEAVVREDSRFNAAEPVEFVNAPPIDPARFNFALASPLEITDLMVRIVPENLSEIAKSDDPGDGGGDAVVEDVEDAEIMVAVEKGDTLEKILVGHSVDEATASEVAVLFDNAFDLPDLAAGDRVRLAFAPAADGGDGAEVLRVSIYGPEAHKATVARADTGAFVAAEEPDAAMPLALATATPDEEAVGSGGGSMSLYQSLYQTALEQDLPETVIRELVRIYSFDVDFNAPVRPGDAFETFYALDEDGQPTASPEVLYAALTVGGTTRKFYRYRAPDDGSMDFYDETGKSAQKFLMRKPMATGVFRSGFGMRRHPILRWVKAHTGVDWAAPTGTPIVASGNGVVEQAEWRSGYGRWVKLRHTNGYETGYAHLSGIAKGIKPGIKVRQGQVIGYVGSTGLSTGPHLHYEVHINGRPVDPLRIRLPRGRELNGTVLTSFSAERDRIDALIGKPQSSTKVAQGS